MNQDALRWLQEQQLAMVEATRALSAINSHTANPEGVSLVQDDYARMFEGLGLTRERVTGSEHYGAHQVLRSSGVGAPVLLVGHADTVFPKGTFESVQLAGDRLEGPGVLDMKGGLVVVAYAVRALAQSVGLAALPPLHIVVVADEEVGSPEGTDVLKRAARLGDVQASAALVFESGRANDAIVTCRKGVGLVRVSARGKAAHAGNAHAEGINAVWALAQFADGAQRLTDYAHGITVNVGTFKGGTSQNTVAENAVAELDLRFEAVVDADALMQRLEALARRAEASVPGVHIEIEGGVVRYPMERLDASGALYARYAEAAVASGLAAPESPLVGGGSDANTTAALGIASIDALGPRGTGFHTREEYIDITTMVPKAQALARLLLGMQAVGTRPA